MTKRRRGVVLVVMAMILLLAAFVLGMLFSRSRTDPEKGMTFSSYADVARNFSSEAVFVDVAKGDLHVYALDGSSSKEVSFRNKRITIVGLVVDPSDATAAENLASHLNQQLLEYACYEFSSGDKRVGLVLLGYLADHHFNAQECYREAYASLTGEAASSHQIAEHAKRFADRYTSWRKDGKTLARYKLEWDSWLDRTKKAMNQPRSDVAVKDKQPPE